jgi:hypothetical protein
MIERACEVTTMRRAEPFDDPVVGVLGAWPSRQFRSDRYAESPGRKAWATSLFLDQISALSRYCFGRLLCSGLMARAAKAIAPADNIKMKTNPPSSTVKTPA